MPAQVRYIHCTLQVSDYPLMCLEPDDRGTFIAVGSENGSTTVLELSHHLIDLQKNEKNIFLSVRTTVSTFFFTSPAT